VIVTGLCSGFLLPAIATRSSNGERTGKLTGFDVGRISLIRGPFRSARPLLTPDLTDLR
jgi:hypothetical protein